MKGSKEQRIKNICSLFKAGFTNSEISEELEIELTTVKNYMKRYIRTREDYKEIKQVHDIRKKKMQEIAKMNKRVRESAKREIDRQVKKYISDKSLCEKWCNSAYEYRDGAYRYKYDKNSKPSDLPTVYRAS